MKMAAPAQACGSANGNEKAVSPAALAAARSRLRLAEASSRPFEHVGERGPLLSLSQAGAFSTTCSIRSKLTFGGRAREFLRKGERGARPLGVPLGTASRRAAIRSHGPVTAGNSGGMEIKLRRNRLKTLKRGGESR
jgi:hypothetical protein